MAGALLSDALLVNPFISSFRRLFGSFPHRFKEMIMLTQPANQKTVVPNRSGVLRALLGAPMLLLALALSGCTEPFPNYYRVVDRLYRQSNVELMHALPRPATDGPIKYGSDSVAFVNDTTLAVGATDSVYFVDVRDPATPTVISVFNFPDMADPRSSTVMPMDGYVYASARDRATKTRTLFVIDIREPTSPKEVHRQGVRTGGWVAEDGYLYRVSILSFGVQIWDAWDASRPSDLSMLGVYYPPQARLGLDQIDPIYRLPPVTVTPRQVAAERALGAFSANEDPAACDDWYRGRVGDVDVEDGLLYVGVGDAGCVDPQGEWHLMDEGGLWIVDVGNPAEPIPLGFQPLGDLYLSIDDITVVGNYAYLAVSVGGLQIVDVSDPTKPALVGGHATPYSTSAIAVEDDIAYVADFDSVQVFDVANPAKPVRIGMMTDDFYRLSDIAVRAGYIYLTGYNYRFLESSFYVLRLLDPQARPSELIWGASSD